jgi:cytochrome oxidase Cu insertion factor (SCO1/SenC/PrrC family)
MHMSGSRRIHSGLILAGGLFGLSLSVLIMGASRSQATDAGLPGSSATPFTLKDDQGHAFPIAHEKDKPTVLIVARDTTPAAQLSEAVRQIHQTFAGDAGVHVYGVQISSETGLLDTGTKTTGTLRAACPELTTVDDVDGALARAYRVTDAPTVFVIDTAGVLRGLFSLNGDGTAVTVAATVSALRPAKTDFIGLQLPR